MTEMRFDKLVEKHFIFLVREHGYKINFIDHSNYPDPSIEDGEAEVVSKRTLIYVMKSRGDYDFRIGPKGEPKFTRLFPLTLLHITGVQFENFPINNGLSKFEWALVLHEQLFKSKHLERFIDGDFSQWLDILELDIKEYKGNYFRKTNRELPEYKFKDLEEYISVKKMQNHYP